MKTMTVGELEMHFSDVLDAVRKGETIVVRDPWQSNFTDSELVSRTQETARAISKK